MTFPWATLVRAVLKFGGGYFVQKGITDDSTVEVIAAGGAALWGVIWGYVEKRQHQKQVTALEATNAAQIQI